MGVIGLGNIGKAHIGHIIEGRTPEVELTAAADSDEKNRKWAAERCPAVFEEGIGLINSNSCDAVLIATPHYLHPEHSIAALKAGLHVLCEKPAGVYTKHVREMIEEAAKRPCLAFGMMLNQRTNCVYRKMRELVRNGELGAVKRVNWIITDWYRPQFYYDSGGWRATWDGEGGGVLINQCLHNLDLLQWICGMPSRVHAFCHEGKWHDIEVEDDVTAYMEFANGATGVMITSTGDAPGTNRFEIILEGGKLVCEGDKLILWRLEENERAFCKRSKDSFAQPPHTADEVVTDGQNQQHVGVLNAFAANILRGESLTAHGSEGLNSVELCNAIYLSGWLGQTVELPVDEDVYLAELNKRRKS
jgi:predicted dehydrogenase